MTSLTGTIAPSHWGFSQQKSSSYKALIVAQQGAGKTFLIASLLNAGKKVYYLDFDKGASILPKIVKPEFHKNIMIESFSSNLQGTKVIGHAGIEKFDKIADSINPLCRLPENLEGWKGCFTGDKDTYVVMDTMTHFCEQLYSWAYGKIMAQSKTGQINGQAVYGLTQDAISKYMSFLTSDQVTSNIIILGHVKRMDDEISGESQTTIVTKGKALDHIIGSFFNNIHTIEHKKSPGSTKIAEYILRPSFSKNVLCKYAGGLDVAEGYSITPEKGLIDLINHYYK